MKENANIKGLSSKDKITKIFPVTAVIDSFDNTGET